jgi:tetratricopeptide (TPR) repeat protein
MLDSFNLGPNSAFSRKACRPLPGVFIALYISVIIFICSLLSCGFVVAGEPSDLLREADRLAWLGNWHKAAAMYDQAEKHFSAAGDRLKELYAKAGQLRSRMDNSSSVELSDQFAELLKDTLAAEEPRLKMRVLAYKGDVDFQCNLESARNCWRQVLELSKKLNERAWMARATGELGILAYVIDGDTSTATNLVREALMDVGIAGDTYGTIRYLTLAGRGLTAVGRYDTALEFFERALTAAKANPETAFPIAVYIAKARTLTAMNDINGAKLLLTESSSAGQRDRGLDERSGD